MYEKIIPKDTNQALDYEGAENIRSMFKTLNTEDVTTVFINQNKLGFNYTNEEIIDVKKLLTNIETEIISKMSGSYVLTPGIPAVTHIDEETGEKVIDSPVILPSYFEVTTKTALIESITSDLLNIEEVVNDFIKYYKVYDADRTWVSFKALFNTQE